MNRVSLTTIVFCVLIALGAGIWWFVRVFETGQSALPGSLILPTTASSTQVFTSTRGGYAFTHPKDLPVSKGSIDPTRSWFRGATDPGVLDATTTIPAAFEPETNFTGALFSVGRSANERAVLHCVSIPSSTDISETKVDINGASFTRFASSEEDTDGFSETTSYRIVHGDTCYAIEYTIHSARLGTADSNNRVIGFDKTKIVNLLEYMVRSFQFQ